MLMIRCNPQWISEQPLCVFISVIIFTYMGNACDVPSKELNHLPWDTVLNAPTTDDKIVHLCDHHQKNYKSHDNIMNEENSIKYIESNEDEITYHNSDENKIEKSGLLHNNFLLDDILPCYRNVTVLYLAGYDDEIFELRNDLLKKGNGNELLIYLFLYSDHKFFSIGKIHTNIIFFDESVLKYSHYYYLNSETVKNICCYNKLRFENLIESVPDEAIDEKKSKYFTVYPQKESGWYEFVIPKGKDMFIKEIIVDLNKNKDNKLNKPAGLTSSILDQPNDNEIYYVNEDFLNTCIQSKYLKQRNENKTMNKNLILKSYMEISPPIKLESKLEDILDEQSKSILYNTKKVLVPCNDDKLEQNNENLSTFIPVTLTVTNNKPKENEKTRLANIFKDKSFKTFHHHKDTTYYKLPKILDSYTKTMINQVYSYKNPFSDVDLNRFNIALPIIFQGNKIDKISNNKNNRVLPNDSQYYSYEKAPNNILLNTEYDISKPNYKAFPHIHTLHQYIPNKKLPTEVVSKNTDFNFHTQIKNNPFNRFKPLSPFSDGSYKILDSYVPYNNNYDLNPNYVTYEQNLKRLKNKKYSTKNPFVDFSIPIITSSSNIKINDKNKKIAYLPEAYYSHGLNSATQKQKDEPKKTLIHTPSILNIPCQKLTNDKSRILNAVGSNILNTPRKLGASLINTNAKLSAIPKAQHGYISYSSKYNTINENQPDEIKKYPYYSKYNELLPASYLPKFYTTNRNFSPDLYQPIPTKIYQPLKNILESSNAPMNGNPNRIQKVKSDFLLFKEKPIISGILSEKKPQNIVLLSSEQEGAQATDDNMEKKYFMNTQSPLNVVIYKHKNAIPNSNIYINLTDYLNFIKKVNIPRLSTLKQESYENTSWFKKYQQNIRELLPYTKLSYLPKINLSTEIPFQNSYTLSDPIYSSEILKSPHISMSVTPAPFSSEKIHMSKKPVHIMEFPSSIDLSILSKNIKRPQFVSIPKFNLTRNQYLSTYHLSSKPQTKTVSAFSIKFPAIPLSNTFTLNQEPTTSNVFNNKNLSSLTNLSQQWFLPQSNLPSPITSQIVAMPERNKILYRPEQNFKEYSLKSYLLSKPQVVTAKAYSPIISIPKVSSPPLSLYEAIPSKLTIEEISPIPSYKKIFKVNKPDVPSNTMFSLPQDRLKSSIPSFYKESPPTKDTVYVNNFKLHTIPYVLKIKPFKYRNWPQNNITLPITSPYMVVPERNLALQLAKHNLDQYPLTPYLSAMSQSVPASVIPIILLPTSTPQIKSSSRSPVPGIHYIPQNDLTSPITSQHVAMAEINKYLHLPKKNVNQYPPQSYSTPEAVTKKGFSIKSPIISLPRMSPLPALPLYKAIPNKPTNQEILPISSHMERKLNDTDISTNTIFKPNFNQGTPTAIGTLSNRNLKVHTNPCTAKSSQLRDWPQNIIPIVSPYVILPESIQKLHLSKQNLNLYRLKTYLSPKLQSEPALSFPISSQDTSILALTSSSKSPVSVIRHWPQNILTSSIASPHLASPERNNNLYISKQNVTQYTPKLYSSSKPQPVFNKSPITLFPEVMSSSSPLPLYETAPNNSIIQEILPIIKPSMSSNVIFTLPQQPLKSSTTNFNQESPTTLSNKNVKVQTNPCVTNHVPSQYRDWPQNNIPSSIASPYVVTPERNQNLQLPKKSPLQSYLPPKLQSLRASSLPFTQLTHIPAVKSSSLSNKPVKIILLNHLHKQLTLPKQHFKPNLLTENQEPVLSKNIFNSLQLEPYILKPTIAEPFHLKKNPTQISLPKHYNSYKPIKIHDSSPETIVQNALLPIPSSITSTLPMLSLPTSYKLPYPKYKTYNSKKIHSLPKQFSIPYDEFKVLPTNEYKSIPKSKLNTVPSTSPLPPTITKTWSPKSKAYATFFNRISPSKQFTLRHAPLIPIEFSKPIDKNVNSSTIKLSVLLTQPTFKYSLNLNSHRITLPSLLPPLSSFNQYPYQPTSSDFNPLNISTTIKSISPVAISLNNDLYLKPGSITFKFLLPHLLPKKHSQNKITSKLSSSANSLLEKSLQYQIPTTQDTVFKVRVDNLPLSTDSGKLAYRYLQIDNTNNKKHFPNSQTLPISNMKSFIPNFKVQNQIIWHQIMANRIKTRPIPDIASYSKFLSPLNTINLPVKPNSYKHTAHPQEIHTTENYIKPPSKYLIKLQPLHSQICNLAPYSYYSSPLRTRKKYSSHKPYISFPSKMNLKSPNSFMLSDITSKSIQPPLITSSEPSKPDLPSTLSSTLAHPLETSILPFTPLGQPLSEINLLNLLTERKLLKKPSTLPFKYDLNSHHRHYEPLQTLDAESSVLYSDLKNYSIIHNKYKNILKSFYKDQNYLTFLKEKQVIPKEFKTALLSLSPIFNLHSNSNLDGSSTPYTNLSNHYTWSQTKPKFTYKYNNNLPVILQDQVNFNKGVKDKTTNKHLPLQPNSSFIPFKLYLSYIKPFIKTRSNYQTDLQGTSAPIIIPSYQSIYVKNGPTSQFKTTNILSIPSKWIELRTPQAPDLGPFKSDLTYLSPPLLKSSSILTSSLHHPIYKTLETFIPPPNLIKKSTWPLNKHKFTHKSVDKYQNYQQTFNLQDRAILSRNINTQSFLTPIAKVASKSKSFNRFKLYPTFKPLNIQAFKVPFSISNVDTTHKNIILQPDLSYLKPSERSSIQDYYQTLSPYQLAWPKTISTDNFKDIRESLYHIQTSKLPTNWQLKKSLTLDMNIIKPNLAYSSPTILSSAKESYHKNADFSIDKTAAFEKSSPYPFHSNLNVKSGTYSIYKGDTNKIKYFSSNTEIPNKIVNYVDTGKYNQINYLQNKPKIKNQLYSNILYKNDNYQKYYPMIFSVKHRTQIVSPLGNLNTYPHELITDGERNLKIPIAKILEKSCRPDLALRKIVTNNEINENIPYKGAQGTKHVGKETLLPNISILKYDPREINNSVEIETDNPDIFIKAWISRIEIIKPRIVYDTFHVQAFNFEPLVKEVSKYDPNVVNDVVKSYVEKYYGEPIVLKGMYNFYKPYIISNVNKEYLKHGKIYLVWPTLCDCGCKCFGCRCSKKLS